MENKPQKQQNFLQGAAVLAVSIAIIKVLGFIYKIPLFNILDDQGVSYFNVAYNIYLVLLTISTAGLPVAVSRLVAEANALGRPMQVKKIFRVSMAAFLVLGGLGSFVMFAFSTELAAFMGTVEASQGILAMSPAVILVCILSAYRGYLQGHSDMTPTSVSQVIEVALKVAFGLLAAYLLTKAGKSPALISAGAIAGVAVGTLGAIIYIVIKKRQLDKSKPSVIANPDVSDSTKVILRKLIMIGVPIALGSSVMSIITMIDTKITLERLVLAAGFTQDQAEGIFGAYGKALVLSNLPGAFIQALTISIVPAIASSVARKNYQAARSLTESSLRISTILILPMSVGLAVLATPIMNVLYWGKTVPQSGNLLVLLAISSYFICMALMTTAILQAHGNEKLPMVAMIIGGLVKIAVSWTLVGNPQVNIYGSPIGTIVCYMVMCIINLLFLRVKLGVKLRFGQIVLRPAISSAVMGASAWAIYGLCARFLGGEAMGRISTTLAMLIAIGVAIIIYLIFVIITGSITREDMKLIPKGEKLADKLKIK